MLLVTDEEITETLKVLYSLGIVVEPSGAAGLASVLYGKIPVKLDGKTIVVVISGQNISLDDFTNLILANS